MVYVDPRIQQTEMDLIGILAKYPNLIDCMCFDEKYLKLTCSKKWYRYLKENRELDYYKMLECMHQEYADELVNLYVNNIYSDNSAKQMSIGFAKILLEEYKTEQINIIDEQRKLGHINSDAYYYKLTELINLTVEPQTDVLTDDKIDEMLMQEGEGIKIKRFELLSHCLKIGVTDMITVAAPSGFGKSAFLLNIYQSLSQDESKLFKCQYYNIEVSPTTMVKRLLAISSNERKKVDDFNKLNMGQRYYIDAKRKILNDSFIESGSLTIEELKAKVSVNINKEKINVIFIDHIGLLNVTDKYYNKSEYDRVTHCMKELRNFAMDNDLIVFIASQLDRSSVKEEKISMHSLKSSGEIENSSTHVLLLKPSEKETPENMNELVNVIIDVAKNRNGEITKLDNYTFVKTRQVFEERR